MVVLKDFVDRGGLLRNEHVQTLLDDSYPETIRTALLEKVDHRINQLQENYINPFTPFGAIESNPKPCLILRGSGRHSSTGRKCCP